MSGCPWCLKPILDDDTISIPGNGVAYHATCADLAAIARRRLACKQRHMPTPAPLPVKISAPITAAEDPRHTQHGTFKIRAELAQTIKSHLRLAYGGRLAADQKQALDEIAGKVSRICCGDPDDPEHWDDIAGYAKLVADRLKGVAR